MPVDYSKGKIYKIVSDQTDQIYIGSTAEPTLAKRLAGHRRNFQYYQQGKRSYVTSFAMLEYPDAKIILVESYPCANKDELRMREQHYLDNLPNCINRVKAIDSRTNAERKREFYGLNKEKVLEANKAYREANKEELYAKNKEYRENNKEMIAEMKKEYYEVNKERILEYGKQYYTQNKDYFSEHYKLYREQHLEQLINNSRQYYADNKEKINQKRLQKMTCVCGVTHSIAGKSGHLKSKKHKNFVNQ